MNIFEKLAGKNPEDMPVPREELTKLGIPDNISMTRKELEQHLQAKKFQVAAGSTKSIEEETKRQFGELTKEEIDRAEEAARDRQEMGK